MFFSTAIDRTWTLRFFRRLMIAITCAALFATFRVGLVRNFNDIVGTESWGRMLFGVGAAITQMDHGGYGYTIANVVENHLMSGGLTDNADVLAKLGTKFPDNLRNSVLINAAISDATRVKWDFNPNERLRGSGDDDIGFVDYVRASFYLFGHSLNSLYLTYFAILSISVWAYIHTFRLRLGTLAFLSMITIAQGFLFGSSLFDLGELGTITDPRFLSNLAIIPGIHIASLILNRSPPSLGNLAYAAVQSSILAFALCIRSSAIWVILAISILAVGVIARKILVKEKWTVRMWSFGVVSIVVGLQLLCTFQSLHPVYSEKGQKAYHAIWHAFFYQLQFNPKWQQKYAADYGNAVGDMLPMVAAQKYLAQNPPLNPDEVYSDQDHKSIRYDAKELYIRKAFIDFTVADPQFVFDTIFITNSKNIANILLDNLRSLAQIPILYFLLCIVPFLITAAILASHDVDLQIFKNTVFLVSGAFLISLLPNVLTVQHLTVMGDQCFMLYIILSGWAILGVSQGLSLVHWVCTRETWEGWADPPAGLIKAYHLLRGR